MANCTTKKAKYTHLTYDERHTIELRLKDGWSNRKIARELNRAPQTINNEIKRGRETVIRGPSAAHPYRGDTTYLKNYCAKYGQKQYKIEKCKCGRKSMHLDNEEFKKFALNLLVVTRLKKKHSPAIIIYKAKQSLELEQPKIPS